MPPVGFEPTISAGERPKTYALDRAATGTGTGNTVHTNEISDVCVIANRKMNWDFRLSAL